MNKEYDIMAAPRHFVAELERIDEEKRQVRGESFYLRHRKVLGLNPTPQEIKEFNKTMLEDLKYSK